MYRITLLIFIFSSNIFCLGQSLKINRYIPGNYLSDNLHRVEIFNGSDSPINLEGYYLITRNYSVKFPARTVVRPGAVLRIGKKSIHQDPIDFELSRTPDFLIRLADREYEGNFIALLNPRGKIIDAFLHAPIREVPYLPVNDTLITFSGNKIPYALPHESNGAWAFIAVRDDPAIAFVRIGDQWNISSRRQLNNPVTDYRNLSLRFNEGIIAVKWSSSFEANSKNHKVERSEDGQNFMEIGIVPVERASRDISQYEFYDADVKTGVTYYYRIRNDDKVSMEIISGVKEITAEEIQDEFLLEAFPGYKGSEGELSVRFYSRFSQKVKIKIMDLHFREIAIIFNGYVNARSRNLLKLTKALPAGSYRIFADTESKRFVQEITVQ